MYTYVCIETVYDDPVRAWPVWLLFLHYMCPTCTAETFVIEYSQVMLDGMYLQYVGCSVSKNTRNVLC